MDVTRDGTAPVEGASVRIAVEYQREGSTAWVRDDDVVGTSTATGSITFHSGEYHRTGGNRVARVRFTTASATSGLLVWQSAANPLTVEIAGPVN